jgi:hypothetical protein
MFGHLGNRKDFRGREWLIDSELGTHIEVPPLRILRPGFFMENYDGKIGSIAVGVLKKGLKPTTTSQLVVSNFSMPITQTYAQQNYRQPKILDTLQRPFSRCGSLSTVFPVLSNALQDPQSYASQILVVSGEGQAVNALRETESKTSTASTMAEQEEAYKRATGKNLPAIPGWLARALIAFNSHTKALYVLIPFSLTEFFMTERQSESQTSNAYTTPGRAGNALRSRNRPPPRNGHIQRCRRLRRGPDSVRARCPPQPRTGIRSRSAVWRRGSSSPSGVIFVENV